jgi:hypothetical protein
MSVKEIKILLEMAENLLATAEKLPSGPERMDALQTIQKFAAGNIQSHGSPAAYRDRAEGEGEMTERRLQPWTPSDDEQLRKLAGEGRNATTIAERLKRSPHAVRNRAKNLGIMLVKASGLPRSWRQW